MKSKAEIQAELEDIENGIVVIKTNLPGEGYRSLLQLEAKEAILNWVLDNSEEEE